MAREIPGDLFKPFFGLVHQQYYDPIGSLIPWKMTRTTIDGVIDEVETPNNAVPGFGTGTYAKRKATGTVHNACFDLDHNIFGVNPYGLPFTLKEGMVIRAMMSPDTSVVDDVSIGSIMGTPITGDLSEIPTMGLTLSWVFLAMRIMRIRGEADAAAGLPFDFDWKSVYPYAMPGENLDNLVPYGFSTAPGVGGFFG